MITFIFMFNNDVRLLKIYMKVVQLFYKNFIYG